MRIRDVGLSSRKFGDEVVVLDLDGSRYLTISGSGVLLFELLREEHDRDELVAALLTAFEVDEDMARHDVDASLPTCPAPACSPADVDDELDEPRGYPAPEPSIV
jgi:hypothetical protein